MSHPERNEFPKVAVEDLLRLKRAERPSPDFWNRFEQELRAKQLAAIVERRPWWISLGVPQVARYLLRFQVPVGAAAVLALSFVVVREYRSQASTRDFPTPLALSQGAPIMVTSLPYPYVGMNAAASPVGTTSLVRDSSANPPVISRTQSLSVEGPASVGPGGAMAMTPWAPQTVPASNDGETVILGELSQVHFATPTNPGRDHDFKGRVEIQPVVMPGRLAAVETVTSTPAVSPRELRRNRILSNLVVADASEERSRLAQVSEAVVSVLDDGRLYDTVQRLGMGGDRLTLKF